MKFLRLFVALFLFALPVEARTLIAVEGLGAISASASQAEINGKNAQINSNAQALVTGFISRFNPGSYDVVYLGSLRPNATGSGTEQLRTGVVNGVTYSSVIYPNFQGSAFNTRPYTTCWPCSLTYVAMHPTVPQLFCGSGLGETAFFTGNSASLRCSTLAGGDQMDPPNQTQNYTALRTGLVGSPYVWHAFGAPPARLEPVQLAVGPGVTRVVIGETFSCVEQTVGSGGSFTGTGNCPFRDSTATMDAGCTRCGGSGDGSGGIVWIRYPVNNTYTASPIIFCRWQSHAVTGRGGGANQQTTLGGDVASLYGAIALLDSLTGNGVLGTAKPEPVKVAFQIEGAGDVAGSGNYIGGYTTAGTSWGGAIEPVEFPVFAASCESLTARKIKVTFGVDVLRAINVAYKSGSAGTCIDAQLAAIKAMPLAHFSPMSNTRILGTGGTVSGAAFFKQPVDPFGYSRVRTYHGPSTSQLSAGAIVYDSSRVSLMRGGFFLVDSLFGPGRRGTIAMPARGNWSGVDMATNPDIDSLIYTCRAAGYTGIASDAQGDTLKTATSFPWANGSGQRTKTNRLGDGSPFMFLTYPGRSLATLDCAAGIDETTNSDDHAGTYSYAALVGLILPQWNFPENFASLSGENGTYGETGQVTSGNPGLFGGISANANVYTGVNLMRFSCAGLCSGERQQSTGSPDRPDYWTMVHMQNAFSAINRLAGRTLFQIVYDSELGPRDVRR